MKYLKRFESYTSKKPYSFDSVFKITKDELSDYLADLIDNFDYIDFDIVSDKFKSFDLEIYSNSKENLKSEFEWYKKEVSENIKNQLLQMHSLKVVSENFNEERNRIIIKVSPEISLKK